MIARSRGKVVRTKSSEYELLTTKPPADLHRYRSGRRTRVRSVPMDVPPPIRPATWPTDRPVDMRFQSSAVIAHGQEGVTDGIS